MPDTVGAFWWIGPVISVVGAMASWTAFIVSLRQRRVADQLAMDREYDQLANARENYWTALREAYDCFRMNRPELPGKLEVLINAAGAPPGLPRPSGHQLRTWAVEKERSFGPDQRTLWEFSSAVYPARDGRTGEVTDHTLVDREKARAFHEARGNLARFWNTWVPTIGLARAAKRFKSARLQIMVLSWLEPALIRWTQDDGEGKKDLFRLAERIPRSV